MTRNVKCLLTLTAGLMTLGAAAIYAENGAEVDITFPFSTAAGTLPAGTYTVQRLNSSAAIPVVVLRNKLTNQASLLMGNRLDWEDARPKLIFRCVNGDCSLAKIWLGGGKGFEFMQPRKARARNEHLATINMHPE